MKNDNSMVTGATIQHISYQSISKSQINHMHACIGGQFKACLIVSCVCVKGGL